MSSLYFPFQISKLVTWEVVLSVGAVFGLLFGYERLTWTDSAKERAIKEQVGRLGGDTGGWGEDTGGWGEDTGGWGCTGGVRWE